MYICYFTNWGSLYMDNLKSEIVPVSKNATWLLFLLILFSKYVRAGFRGVVVIHRLQQDDELHKLQKTRLNNWIFRKVLSLNLLFKLKYVDLPLVTFY